MWHDLDLVGRGTVRDRVLRSLLPSRPSATLLTGPAGVGKTHLARHCAARLQGRGFVIAPVTASPATRDVPLGALVRFLPRDQPIPEPGVDALRAVATAIEQAREAPLLLVVDDVHHLDPQSAWLLHDLVTSGGASLLATARTPEPVPAEVRALITAPGGTRVEVGPFSRGESDTVVERLLGGPALPSLLEQMWRAAGGNALLLRETVLGARESGELRAVDGRWALTGDLAISPRLTEVITARLTRLDRRSRTGLEVVAVAGEVPVELLERHVTPDALAGLERAGHVVAGDAPGWVQPAHPLVAEVVLRDLPLPRVRAICDALAGSWSLEDVRGPADALRLARWQLEAGRLDRATFIAASNAARYAGDHELAERLAREALEQGELLAAVIVLATVLGHQGRHDEALSVVVDVDVAPLSPAQRRALAVMHATVLFWGLGRAEDARTVLRMALEETEDEAQRHHLRTALATYDLFAGRSAAAGRAVAPMVAAGVHRQVPAVAIAAAGSAALLGRGETGWRLADEALAAPPSTRDEGQEVMLAVASVMAATAAGRLVEGEALGMAAHRRAVEAGSPFGQGFLGLLLGRLILFRGHARRAERWLHEAYLHFGRGGFPAHQRWCLGARAMALGLAGEGDVAARLLAEAEELPVRGLTMMRPEMHRARAWAAWTVGNRGAVAECLSAALDAATAQGSLTHEHAVRHDRLRLGLADRTDLEALQELAGGMEGPLPRCRARHAAATLAEDPVALATVGEDLAGVGADLFAAEALAQAAGRRTDREAERWRHRATSLRDGCGPVHAPLLRPLAQARPATLTAREEEVAVLAARGLPSKQIAATLVVSRRTVDNHLQRIYRKLGIHGRDELPHALDRDGVTTAPGSPPAPPGPRPPHPRG